MKKILSSHNMLKINFSGANGVGKKTFMHRHATGVFFHDTSSLPNEMKLSFSTNKAVIKALVCNEGETAEGECDARIIFFDVQNQESYLKAIELVKQSTVPTVLVGNKVDLPGRVVTGRFLGNNLPRAKILDYFDLSGKSNYNFGKPFLSIFRYVKNDGLLFFTEILAVKDVKDLGIVKPENPNTQIREKMLEKGGIFTSQIDLVEKFLKLKRAKEELETELDETSSEIIDKLQGIYPETTSDTFLDLLGSDLSDLTSSELSKELLERAEFQMKQLGL